MIIFRDQRFACDSCINGHRAVRCTHQSRILICAKQLISKRTPLGKVSYRLGFMPNSTYRYEAKGDSMKNEGDTSTRNGVFLVPNTPCYIFATETRKNAPSLRRIVQTDDLFYRACLNHVHRKFGVGVLLYNSAAIDIMPSREDQKASFFSLSSIESPRPYKTDKALCANRYGRLPFDPTDSSELLNKNQNSDTGMFEIDDVLLGIGASKYLERHLMRKLEVNSVFFDSSLVCSCAPKWAPATTDSFKRDDYKSGMKRTLSTSEHKGWRSDEFGSNSKDKDGKGTKRTRVSDVRYTSEGKVFNNSPPERALEEWISTWVIKDPEE